MKKEKKPLNLTKETLRALTRLELSDVAGGGLNGTKVGQGYTCTCTSGGQTSGDGCNVGTTSNICTQ
jgi:hypothetical protein